MDASGFKPLSGLPKQAGTSWSCHIALRSEVNFSVPDALCLLCPSSVPDALCLLSPGALPSLNAAFSRSSRLCSGWTDRQVGYLKGHSASLLPIQACLWRILHHPWVPPIFPHFQRLTLIPTKAGRLPTPWLDCQDLCRQLAQGCFQIHNRKVPHPDWGRVQGITLRPIPRTLKPSGTTQTQTCFLGFGGHNLSVLAD